MLILLYVVAIWLSHIGVLRAVAIASTWLAALSYLVMWGAIAGIAIAVWP